MNRHTNKGANTHIHTCAHSLRHMRSNERTRRDKDRTQPNSPHTYTITNTCTYMRTNTWTNRIAVSHAPTRTQMNIQYTLTHWHTCTYTYPTHTSAHFSESDDRGGCHRCQEWLSHPREFWGRRMTNEGTVGVRGLHQERGRKRERGRREHKPKSWKWRWRRRRNNQFSDISKCALDDAYLNRPEMVHRERS